MPELKPWEVIIEEPQDMYILADVLHDWNHPGEEIVRDLITRGRFPFVDEDRRWSWCVSYEGVEFGYGSQDLEEGELAYLYNHFYFTATEAVWAVINAGIYKSKVLS